MMSSPSFEPELYHPCVYIRFPEDEPLGSEHVDDIIN